VTLRERWSALSARERYLIAAAAAVALLVVVRYAPLGRLTSLSFGGEDEQWVQVQKIKNYQKVVARQQSVEELGKKLKARYAEAQSRLIAGETPTQVGAELQGQLSSMAADAELNVLSSQILREESYAGFRRVGVRLTLSGTLEGVTSLLSSIETGQSDLAVTLLEINRKLGASRRPSTRSSSSSPAVAAPLTATMEVKTFMRESL
jgi:hypothetical protein